MSSQEDSQEFSRVFSQDSHVSSITTSQNSQESSQESKENSRSFLNKLNLSIATVPLFLTKSQADFEKTELAIAHAIFAQHSGLDVNGCDCMVKHLTPSEIERKDVSRIINTIIETRKFIYMNCCEVVRPTKTKQQPQDTTTSSTSLNESVASTFVDFMTSILRSSVRSTSSRKRCDYNYCIGVHVANPIAIRPIDNLCQKAFIEVYGLKRKLLSKVQSFVKTGKHDVDEPDFCDNTGAYSLEAVDELASKLGQPGIGFELCDDAPLETVRAMAIPDTEQTKLCISWMQEHFDRIGDKCPKSNEIHLEKQEKIAIYQEYCRGLSHGGIDDELLVSYSHFVTIWEKFLPHVKIRTYKAVTGKCAFCAVLTEARQQFHRNDARQYITDLHALHRATYMSERCVYYKKISKAIIDPGNYMSIIMDGMAQNHTELPYLGNMKDFPAKMDMHLQGVIEHGQEFAIYRTFANLSDDSNVAIHCFLMQLESRMQRDQKRTLPDTVFVQMDGGAENANVWLLGICELLVAKRLTKRIYLTRLPVGHTHEDIDGKFGKLWDHVRNKVLISPQAYAEAMHKAFASKKPPFVCHDVFVVPDYKHLVDPFVDNIAGWAKEEHTQLCWKFCAVDRCAEFPLGVQTMYRAYANDIVFEVYPDEVSPIKWSAKVTVTDWQPRASASMNSYVDGMYILQGLPRGPIIPAPFTAGHTQVLKKTLAYINDPKWYGQTSTNNQHTNALNAKIIREWNEFASIYPKSDDVTHYLEDFEVYIPLKQELFGDMEVLCNYTSANTPSVLQNRQPEDLEDSFMSGDFDDPHNVNHLVDNLTYQYSTPSVVWKNRGHSLPYYPTRLFSANGMLPNPDGEQLDKLRLEELRKPLESYKDCTIRKMHEILRARNVTHARSLNKDQLIQLLTKLDEDLRNMTN